jgi:FkbM family methyltransferase
MKIITSIHNLISKHFPLVYILVKIRNQIELILNKRYGAKSIHPEDNGEHLVLSLAIAQSNIFFDVGSNKGEWTKSVLHIKPNSTLYLYEPGTSANSILNEKFSKYSNLHISSMGVSDRIGSSSFFEQDAAGEMSSLAKKWANNSKEIQISLTTIDNEVKINQIESIDYLKIDTEGFDYFVLLGAKETLIRRKIKFIQFEYNKAWFYSGSSLIDAYDMLSLNNYITFLIKEDGLYEFDIETIGDFYCYSNFFSCQKDLTYIFKSIIIGKY